jgi:branched-subunit amino acid aminotransferase/4-amino-4-deoxychorismate lyase
MGTAAPSCRLPQRRGERAPPGVRDSVPVAELDGVAASREPLMALALTNYGHYTSMRVDEGRVRGLSLHLERLMADCRQLFDAELDPDRIRYLLRHALAGAPRSVVVRLSVFDPDLPLGHPGAEAMPSLLVTTRPAVLAPLRALRLRSARYCREMPAVKHVGLFGSLRHRRIAQRHGFDDVLFTDAKGIVSEAATSNIGFVDGARIVWPQAERLTGVTMRLINQARGGDAVTAPVTLDQVVDVDAVFLANAAVGVRAVRAIDGTPCSAEHPALALLRQRYADIPPDPV